MSTQRVPSPPLIDRLRVLLRDVAHLLAESGSTHYEHANAALTALRVVSTTATAHDVLYLATSLATLYAEALTAATYGMAHDRGSGVRAGRLAYAERLGVLAGAAHALVMDFATAEHAEWRSEEARRLRFSAAVCAFAA